ncbi:MAG: fatty acid desaturase family protein [Candidatus Rokuibacteriota bacterium]
MRPYAPPFKVRTIGAILAGVVTSERERDLRARILAELPKAARAMHPWRLVLGIPLLLLIVGGTVAVVRLPLAWYAALPISVGLGALYASLFFFGHEVGHGAIIRSRHGQSAVLYLTCLIYCLSPHLWQLWHNHAHHGHTNEPDRDPDSFGTLEHFRRNPVSQALAGFAPGSGHWLSVLYLLTFFTAQSHYVLWLNSFTEEFRRLDRRRAKLESAAMALFWVIVGVWAGPGGALLGVVIPMLTVNGVMMSYVVTNHMLRPLATGPNALETTMSVSTSKVLDLLFFNFSHHVEHHLFPSMSPRFYPLVRKSLRRLVGDRYLAPSHWRALRLVFCTPRLYADFHTLVDAHGGSRVSTATVEAALRGLAGDEGRKR